MPAHPLVVDAKPIHVTQMLRIHVTSLAGAAHPDRLNFARTYAARRRAPTVDAVDRWSQSVATVIEVSSSFGRCTGSCSPVITK